MKTIMLTVFTLLISTTIHAQERLPLDFTYQGRAFETDGVTPLTGTADFNVQIRSSDGTCLLYEEDHTGIDLTSSAGFFALNVGSGVPVGVADLFPIIFNNINVINTTDGSCAGTFSPTTEENRIIRVTIDTGGTPIQLDDQYIYPVPQAMVADTLDGYDYKDFAMLVADAAERDAIPSPQTGQIVFNYAAQEFNYYDGATWQQMIAGDITGVTAGTGLDGGGTSGDVTIDLADTAVTPGTYGDATNVPQITVDQQGRLTFAGNVAITDNDTTYSAGSGINIDGSNVISVPADGIDNSMLQDDVITSAEIMDGQVGSVDIANNDIRSEDILDGTITADDLANDAVDTAEIADDAVTTDKIATDAVTNNEIADDAVDMTNIANPASTGDNAIDQLMVADEDDSQNPKWMQLNQCGASEYLTYDGTNFTCATDVGSGSLVSSLEGLTGDLTFDDTVVSGANAGPEFTAAGSVISLNIPLASNPATTEGGLITNAEYSALANKALNDGDIFVGNASNIATGVTMSGDATIDNTGALTISNDAVETAMIADDQITTAKIADDQVTAAKIADGAIDDLAKLGLMTCTNGQILKVNAGGTAWECVADDDTTYTASNGITLSTNDFQIDVTDISACTNSSTHKIIWNSTNNRLECATDAGGSGAVTSFEGIDGDLTVSETFVSGTDAGPTFSGAGSTITVNFPSASDANTTSGGLITNTEYNTFNNKQDAITDGVSDNDLLMWDGDSWEPVDMAGDATIANDGSLTIANDAVENAMMADDSVGNAELQDDSVDTAEIVDDAVTTAKIADDQVTMAKIANPASTGDNAIDQLMIADEDDSQNPKWAQLNQCGASEYLTFDGTNFVCATDVGSGGTVASLEGLTGTLTFDDTVSSGADAGPEFSAAGSTITLNIPLASDANTTEGGLLTNAEYAALDGKQDAITDGVSDNDLLMWDGDSWEPVDMAGDATIANDGSLTIAGDAITSAKIADGEIVNDDISGTAQIALSKLADGSSIGSIVFWSNGSGWQETSADDVTCGDGQLLSWDETLKTWACATDADTTYTASNGVALSGSDFQIDVTDISTCTNTATQKIVWNSTNNRLECATDAGGSGAVTSLEGATGALDLAGSVSSGVDAGPTFSESGGVITLNIPLASDAVSTTGGLLTNAEYAALDAKQDAITDGVSDNDLLMWDGDSWEPMDLSGDVSVDNAGAVTIANDAVETAMIGDDQVTTAKIADDAVDADKIADGAIDAFAKLGLMTCSNGQILKVNAGGTAWECAADAGASGTVADLNGQTGSVSVATSVSSGVDAGPTVSAAAGTVTVNIPLASDAASTTGGLLTNAEYTALDGKLDPTLTDGNIFVGNGSNVATGVAMSGDATMDNTGALTIANDAVENSMMADDAVGMAEIANPASTGNDQMMIADESDSQNPKWVDLASCGANEYLTYDVATGFSCVADAGAAGTVASVEGASGTVVFSETFTSGVDAGPTFSGAGSTITANFPLASDAATTSGGLLTNAEYTALDGKLDPTLTDGNIFVGNGSNVATGVAMSGDATMDNTGALTIANDAVETAMIANDAVDADKIADGAIDDLAKIGVMGCSANEILKLNAGGTAWECQADAGGTSISGGTPNALSKFNGSGDNVVDSNVSDDGSTVTVSSELNVDGELITKVNDAAASTSINFDNGNIQYTSANCGAFDIEGMNDGSSYTLVVQGTTSGTCAFTAVGSNSGDTVRLPPGHGATIGGTHTIYTFIKAGSSIYASYVRGY